MNETKVETEHTRKHQRICSTAVLVSHSNTKRAPTQLRHVIRAAHTIHEFTAGLTSSFLPRSKTQDDGDGMDFGRQGKPDDSAGALDRPVASRPLALCAASCCPVAVAARFASGACGHTKNAMREHCTVWRAARSFYLIFLQDRP